MELVIDDVSEVQCGETESSKNDARSRAKARAAIIGGSEDEYSPPGFSAQYS